MATFPTNISWHIGTRFVENLGIDSQEMESGYRQEQTYVLAGDKPIEILLLHRNQTRVEKDQIVDFLRANAKDIQLQDAAQGVTYTGAMMSKGINVSFDGDGTRFQVSWAFAGMVI